jgi:ribonuclease HI
MKLSKISKKKYTVRKVGPVKAPPSLPVGALVVFTDGSCKNNGSPKATAGFACVWPYDEQWTGGWPLKDGKPPTNNRAEFHAFLQACRDADKIDGSDASSVAGKRTLHVFTDSELLVKTVSSYIPQWRKKGWVKRDGAPVMNLDLCQAIAAACDRRAVKMEHVKAHTTGTDPASTYNRQADELASRACRTQQIVK